MKKNYLRFAFTLFILISMTMLTVFGLGITFSEPGFEWNENKVSILQILASLSIVVWLMCLVVALPAFLVKINSKGISKVLGSDILPWSAVDHVKITGLAHISYFNKAVLSGNGKKIELNLFVFDSQEEFVKCLADFLPWVEGLNLDDLPSEARHPGKMSNA